MKLDIFKEKWYDTIVKNKQLFFVNVCLILICFFLVLKILLTKEKIILVPPKITKNIIIESSKVNKEYLIQMGLFLTSLIGNQTPKNTSFLMNILLDYFAPDAYQKLKENILDQISMIRDRGISMVFNPYKVYVDTKKYKVYVYGVQKYKTGKTIEREVNITYEITFKVSDYKIYVVDFIAHTGKFSYIIKGKKSKSKNKKRKLKKQ